MNLTLSDVTAAEVVKARTSRALGWLLVAGVGIPWAFAAVLFGLSEFPQHLSTSQWGYRFGMIPLAAAGVLSISGELQSGSVGLTLLAVPSRWRVLVSKAAVLIAAAVPVGLVAGAGSWLIAWYLQADRGPSLALSGAADYRVVLGAGGVYALTALVGLAIGTLIGRPVPAITVLLVWPILIENVLAGLPVIGEVLEPALPFMAADQFIFNDRAGDPLWSLTYFTAVTAGLLIIALLQFRRADL